MVRSYCLIALNVLEGVCVASLCVASLCVIICVLKGHLVI